MRVVIKKDCENCSLWTGDYIARRINEFSPGPSKPFVLGLPTGSTPVGTYRRLAELYKAGKVDFSNVVTFNMDEYVGLPHDHEQSYHYFMRENFFKFVNLKPENINILNGLSENPDEECAKYEEKIARYGGIHLFLGGVGENGHIAFNEPFSSFQSTTRKVSLTDDTIRANSRFFDFDMSRVPKAALSVGIKTICDSDEVLILITGEKKIRALWSAVEGPVTHTCPVSALQLHKNSVIVCDEPACGDLKPETVKFFMEREDA